MHVVGSKLGRLKVSCIASQPSLISFKRRSTWNLRNPDQHWTTMHAFGLDTKRRTSQHAATSAMCNMSSGDTQNNDNDNQFCEVKLIDAKSLLTVGKNLLIRYKNEKEVRVEYTDPSRQSTSEIDAELGDSSTPCLFLQSVSEPARILALPHPENTVNLFLEEVNLKQLLKLDFVKENEEHNYTGLWLSRGENREYKFTFTLYIKETKKEFKFERSLRALQPALAYDIPIYVHRDILDGDGLQFPPASSKTEPFDEVFKSLLVDMRLRIALAEGRFLDAEFWELLGQSCDIDTILMGPRMGLL
jgi:hypothetical protein